MKNTQKNTSQRGQGKTILILLIISMAVFMGMANVSSSLGFGKQNNCFEIRVISNCSNVNLTEVTGRFMYNINQPMSLVGGQTFNFSFCNTSELGKYSYSWNDPCIDCSQEGSCGNDFEITPNGEELTVAKGIFQIGGIFVLTIFFVLSLLGIFHFENYIAKFTLYWVTHLLGIALTFILWTTSNSFLTDAPFITSFFWILFWILLIAVFPMVILSMVYVFYIHVMNDNIKALIEKGETPEEAFAIAKANRKNKKKW